MRRVVVFRYVGAVVAAFVATIAFGQPPIIPESEKPAQMLENYLRAKTAEAFEQRAAAYEAIKTPEDCVAHQQRIRDFFVARIGGRPEKTPLNARVVDRQDRGLFRLEKVIYESRPQFYVTALLYLPKTRPPYPAVLFPCGHDPNGKAAEAYQRACMFLAANGIAVLCYDPIGQGERAQLLDVSGKQPYNSTIEHTLVSVSSIPLGLNAASYRIWDGIRSIDYLVSRDDIIADRIGCTGNSGGGTLTTYISALDERVFCAAPSCYITSLKDLILVDGPHDGEQCVPGQLAFGMDHGDYLMARAPKPTLVCCATRDFFPIAGTWDTYRGVKRFYTRLGYPERVDIAEADEQHGYTILLRQAMVRWMKRWLLNVDDAAVEPDVTVLTDEEALVTPETQVLRIGGARSVFDINRDLLAQRRQERETFWSSSSPEVRLAKIRELTHIRPASELPKADVRPVASAQQQGFHVDHVIIEPEPGVWLPAHVYVPSGTATRIVLLAPSDGKNTVTAECERLVRDGALVMAVDLRNCGETASTWSHGEQWEMFFGPSYKAAMLALMLDRPFIAMWAEDIFVCAQYLRRIAPEAKVSLVTSGLTCPAGLHAAAFEPDLIAEVETREPSVESWENVVSTAENKRQLINVVHDALRYYDLPDLRRIRD